MGGKESEVGETDRQPRLEAQVGAQAAVPRVAEPSVEADGDGIEADGADALNQWEALV